MSQTGCAPGTAGKSRVALVEPSSAGNALALWAAKQGHELVLFTYDRDDRRVPANVRACVKEISVVDTNDEVAVVEAARRCHAREPLAAVVPGFEYFVPLAARIAGEFSLPGLPQQSAWQLRRKDLMRHALSRCGVRVPRYEVIHSIDDLAPAARSVGYPCVLKPVDMSGSLYVRRADTFAELKDAYTMLRTDSFEDLGRRPASAALVEQYIWGPEFSVEGYVDRGAIYIVSITEKLLGPEPFFVEMGHIVEASLEMPEREAIAHYVRTVVSALDITLGPFHAEVRLSPDGPTLMETGARLPGDRICDLIDAARGVNFYDVMIRSYLGQPIGAPIPERKRVAGIRFVMHPDLERYAAVTESEELRRSPEFTDFQFLIRPGEPVPAATSFRGRLAYAIFVGDSYAAVRSRLDALDRLVRVVSRPDDQARP